MIKNIVIIACFIALIFSGNLFAGEKFNLADDVFRIVSAAYENNKLAAEKKYKGLRINLVGEVFSIKKNLTGKPTVTLKAGSLSYVSCEFSKDTPDINALMSLSKGDTFKCEGTIRSFVLRNVFVEDCLIR